MGGRERGGGDSERGRERDGRCQTGRLQDALAGSGAERAATAGQAVE